MLYNSNPERVHVNMFVIWTYYLNYSRIIFRDSISMINDVPQNNILNPCYPLMNVYITMEHHHISWENSRNKWWFSIVMLNYQRLNPCLKPNVYSSFLYISCLCNLIQGKGASRRRRPWCFVFFWVQMWGKTMGKPWQNWLVQWERWAKLWKTNGNMMEMRVVEFRPFFRED